MALARIYNQDDPDLPPLVRSLYKFFATPTFGEKAKLSGYEKARLVIEKIKAKSKEKQEQRKQLEFAALGEEIKPPRQWQ